MKASVISNRILWSAAMLLLLVSNAYLAWTVWGLSDEIHSTKEGITVQYKYPRSTPQSPIQQTQPTQTAAIRDTIYIQTTPEIRYIVQKAPEQPQLASASSSQETERTDAASLIQQLIPLLKNDPEAATVLEDALAQAEREKTNEALVKQNTSQKSSRPFKREARLMEKHLPQVMEALEENPALAQKLVAVLGDQPTAPKDSAVSNSAVPSTNDFQMNDTASFAYTGLDSAAKAQLEELLLDKPEEALTWLQEEAPSSDSSLVDTLEELDQDLQDTAPGPGQVAENTSEAEPAEETEEQDDPGKSISVDWKVGAHLGYQNGTLDLGGNTTNNPLGVHAEMLLEERLGIFVGARYTTYQGETEDQGVLTIPADFPAMPENINNSFDEIKVKYSVLTVPLDVRYHLFPQFSFSPYILGGASFQTFYQERYDFKNENTIGDQWTYREDGIDFGLNSVRGGLGVRHYFDPRLSGAFQSSYEYGLNGAGTVGNTFDGFQFLVLLSYQLSE